MVQPLLEPLLQPLLEPLPALEPPARALLEPDSCAGTPFDRTLLADPFER